MIVNTNIHDDGDEVAMPPIIGVGMIGRLGEAPGEEWLCSCGDNGSGCEGEDEPRPGPPFIVCCIRQWILNQFERRP